MGYVNRTINNILRKTTLDIKKTTDVGGDVDQSHIPQKIWTFSILIIAKLNLRETVLKQKNAKHNSRENKLVYSTPIIMLTSRKPHN
jgi:hypothetical protein